MTSVANQRNKTIGLCHTPLIRKDISRRGYQIGWNGSAAVQVGLRCAKAANASLNNKVHHAPRDGLTQGPAKHAIMSMTDHPMYVLYSYFSHETTFLSLMTLPTQIYHIHRDPQTARLAVVSREFLIPFSDLLL